MHNVDVATMKNFSFQSSNDTLIQSCFDGVQYYPNNTLIKAWLQLQATFAKVSSLATTTTKASTICSSLGELTVTPNDSDVTWRSDGHF